MKQPETYLGWKVDFRNPPGEPSGLEPDSMHWKVYKNPVAMAVGGVAAVLLEFADARIRSGVWDHSIYKQDPIGRSKRTGVAAMVGVYGPKRAAERVIRGVTNMHSRVNGTTPKGEAYRALDVELLDWVSATAAYGFLTAYDRFVERLSEADKSIYYAEAAPGACRSRCAGWAGERRDRDRRRVGSLSGHDDVPAPLAHRRGADLARAARNKGQVRPPPTLWPGRHCTCPGPECARRACRRRS